MSNRNLSSVLFHRGIGSISNNTVDTTQPKGVLKFRPWNSGNELIDHTHDEMGGAGNYWSEDLSTAKFYAGKKGTVISAHFPTESVSHKDDNGVYLKPGAEGTVYNVQSEGKRLKTSKGKKVKTS